MEKKKQKQKQKGKAPSFGDDGGSPFSQDTQHATIGSGLYQEKLPVAGKTLGEIRAEYADRLEIAEGAVATVAGVEQGNDYRVGANEIVLFIQQAGEKGADSDGLTTVLAKMDVWVADPETWETDLDGMSGIDLAEAVLRKLKRELGIK